MIFDGIVKIIELNTTPQDLKQDDQYITHNGTLNIKKGFIFI